MEETPVVVHVRLDAKIFGDFARFDTFSRQKRWRSPVLFAVLMLAFAAVCFAMNGRAEQAVLLGCVLAAVGVILPLGYLLQFSLSLRDQIKRFGLAEPKEVYTLGFSPECVLVSNGREETTLEWDSIFAAYRRNGCIYLYASANKAFLLPEEQIPCGGDKLWEFFSSRISAQKLFFK